MKQVTIIFMLCSLAAHLQAADQALAILQAAKDHGPYYAYHAAHHTVGPLAIGIDKIRHDIAQPNPLTRLAPSVKPIYINAAAALVVLYAASNYIPWSKIAVSGGTTLYTAGVHEIMSQSKHYKKRWGSVHPSIKFPWVFIVKTMMWG